ncbi:MAG: VOC family protein [Sandaracinus sp.]|nr:VOC family protein [Sandaracinus sp.]
MRLHHLAFRTRDVATLEAFYLAVFALRCDAATGSAACGSLSATTPC